MAAGTILAVLSLVVAVLALLGGPLGAYIAVRVALASLTATVTTKLDDIMRRLDRSESARDGDTQRISALEAKDAAHEARIRSLEKALAQLDTHPPPSD